MISIVIVNWNTRDLLDACLNSVKSKTGADVPYEIIVVDNASTDDSVFMLREKHPEVTILESKRNLGFSGGNNFAIPYCRGEYIVLLNPDTLFLNDVLHQIQDTYADNEDIGVIGTGLVTGDGHQQRYARGGQLNLRTTFNHLFYFSGILPKSKLFPGLVDNCSYSTMVDMDWVSGACMSVRRQIFTQVGLLDESLFMYSEDMDFCFRAKQAGYRVVYLPFARVQHFVSQAIKKQPSLEIVKTPVSSNDMVFRKLHGGRGIIRFRLVVWLGYSLRVFVWALAVVVYPTPRSRWQARQSKLFANHAFYLLRQGRT